MERLGGVALGVLPGGPAQRLVELELEEVRGEEAHVVHALGHVAPRPEVKVVLVALVRRRDACAHRTGIGTTLNHMTTCGKWNKLAVFYVVLQLILTLVEQ